MRIFYDIDSRLDRIIAEKSPSANPVIVRVTGFDEESIEDFHDDMDDAHRTGQPVIPIVIDSFGGSAYGCLNMVSAIQNAKLPVATICTSKAMSAGAILFCFGTEGMRFMDPNAIMMIHDVSSDTFGKVEDIKADATHVDFLNKTMYKRIAKHLGHPDNYFLDLVKQHNHIDWYLTAKDAKKHKIVNHLCVPKFEVKISLDIKFVV